MFGFSKKSEASNKQNVLYFEDFSYKDINEAIAGRKGESLFYLKDLDVPIPDFFVITPAVYQEFLKGAFEEKLTKLLEKVKDPDVEEIEKLILNAKFSESTKQEILRAYSRLSGFSNAWVAVRSSVVYPQSPTVSFSGIFHTELSVKGFDQVLEAIKYVYLSVFKDRVLLYSREKAVDLADLKMAIVVQRMVQPEVSGIAYTLDPISRDRKKLSIEAVFGLGDVITDGSITPDLYTLEKKNLEILEKHISPQDWMRIRKPAEVKVGQKDPFQKIQISPTWSHQQKLEDNYLRDVAKVALIVEDKSRKPESIEWAWESGNVWILQHKPLASKEELAMKPEIEEEKEIKSIYDVALDIVKEEEQKKKGEEAAALAGKMLSEKKDKEDEKELSKKEKELKKLQEDMEKEDQKKKKKEDTQKEKRKEKDKERREKMGLPTSTKDKNMEFILSGIGVSTGTILGSVIVVDSHTPRDLVVTEHDVILVKEFSQDIEPLIMKSGGVVMDDGGLTSDVAILCREIGIPAVTGTGLASTLIKQGDYVMIDGNVGSVYKHNPVKEDEKAEKVEKPTEDELAQDKKVKEKSNENAAVVLATSKAKDEKDEAEDNVEVKKEFTKIPTATKVFLTPQPGHRSDMYEEAIKSLNGYCYVDLESFMLEDGRHPLAYIEDKKFPGYAKQLELILDGYADTSPSDEMIVSIGSATAGQFRELTKGKSLEPSESPDSMFGVQRLLNNDELLKKEIEIIKKSRNAYKNRNISLAVHSPVNKSVFTTMKKEITGGGLKRTGTFNLYAVIDSSSEVILVDEIMDAGIDGIIINTPILAMQMQGLSPAMENPKYDVGVNSVWKMIETLLEAIREENTKVIVIAEDNKKLIKNCINAGVYGVAVHPEDSLDLKQYVSDEEAKMIMSME